MIMQRIRILKRSNFLPAKWPIDSWPAKVALNAISIAVVANGLLIIWSNLIEQLRIRNNSHISELLVTVPLISGMTLVYLGSLLRRQKRAAWAVVVPVYMFILGSNLTQSLQFVGNHRFSFAIRNVAVPLVVVLGLFYLRGLFVVKSNIQNFRFSLMVTILILSTALVYGVIGFQLLDTHDFHQEISFVQAVHRTVDQFDFTTNGQLITYSKRAGYFIDSLNVLTLVAVGYGFISLFQPIKARLSNQAAKRQHFEALLRNYSTNSEDFFKLWPHDKNYFFAHKDDPTSAALAYRVQSGVALVVGDPIGRPRQLKLLIKGFMEFCRVNDWAIALVHITPQHSAVWKSFGFSIQQVGEEAIVDIANFKEQVVGNKYFRQIRSKFERQAYTCQLMQPPHNQALLERLKVVSDDWLSLPGRQERGFMMGHFTPEYMQSCPLLVARDAAGTIQGFLNQLPSFQDTMASFDLLRHSRQSPGNTNDYLLMNFIDLAEASGFTKVNLGLCPLYGVGRKNDHKSVIDSTLRFVYANGDRFYSFSGLHRFKSKYQPLWQPRYIVYKGGLRGFSRALLALNKAMSRLG
jgi:phosphatidylglycerol lysyltransferase